MTKLVTFGCSITYGHGLPDCTREKYYPGIRCSNMAWPSLVAEKMGIECYNMSKPGSSNDLILSNILKFENFNKGDHIIIMWSFINRAMLFTNSGDVIDITPSMTRPSIEDDPKWNHFYEVHTDYDLYIHTIKNMHHARCYLNSMEVNVTNLCVDPQYAYLQSTPNSYLDSMKIDTTPIRLFKFASDLGADGKHPGVKSHIKLAEMIYELHKEKYDTTNRFKQI